jgi:hypothetical protein
MVVEEHKTTGRSTMIPRTIRLRASQPAVNPIASSDTLQGDWLIRLRRAVELNQIIRQVAAR